MSPTEYSGLRNKVALVTGGDSNIGRAIVLGLTEETANVVIKEFRETVR